MKFQVDLTSFIITCQHDMNLKTGVLQLKSYLSNRATDPTC